MHYIYQRVGKYNLNFREYLIWFIFCCIEQTIKAELLLETAIVFDVLGKPTF